MHNHCSSACTYCPSKFWGGDPPRHITEYIDIATNLIEHYKSMERNINWIFDGGEPLEFFDFPQLLKLCKINRGTIELHTSGGKNWLEWLAISQYVDKLNLTYHYWQRPNLIQYILYLMKDKSAEISVKVPIRPDEFDEDLSRASRIENDCNIRVIRSPLYSYAEPMAGLLNYSETQIEILFGKKFIENNTFLPTYNENFTQRIRINPSFTRKKCNSGIEKLKIGAEGWVTGSDCGNENYGNIFNGTLRLPKEPQMCGLLACTSPSDQQITKFD